MQKENTMKEADIVTTEETRISNSKKKDSSAKLIFGELVCAQFLDGYVDIPILKNVRPEGIEDVSNWYVHMFAEERNSDVVKCIHVKDENGNEMPFQLISLIEHKNQVDYNVTM